MKRGVKSVIVSRYLKEELLWVTDRCLWVINNIMLKQLYP